MHLRQVLVNISFLDTIDCETFIPLMCQNIETNTHRMSASSDVVPNIEETDQWSMIDDHFVK